MQHPLTATALATSSAREPWRSNRGPMNGATSAPSTPPERHRAGDARARPAELVRHRHEEDGERRHRGPPAARRRSTSCSRRRPSRRRTAGAGRGNGSSGGMECRGSRGRRKAGAVCSHTSRFGCVRRWCPGNMSATRQQNPRAANGREVVFPGIDIAPPPVLVFGRFTAFGSTFPPTIEAGKPSPKANLIFLLLRRLD